MDNFTDSEFCVIRWSRLDIAGKLKERGIEPTDDVIDEVIDQIGDNLEDISIERGWEVIEQAIG